MALERRHDVSIISKQHVFPFVNKATHLQNSSEYQLACSNIWSIQADMQIIYCRTQAAHCELFVFVAGVNHPFASQDECHHWHDCNINSNLWCACIVRQVPAPRKSSRCWCRDSEVSLKVCLVRIEVWSILIQSLNPCSNNSNKDLHVELSLIAGWPDELERIKLHIQHACTTYLRDMPKWWNKE